MSSLVVDNRRGGSALDPGSIDHGDLANLGDDDHTQYHTDARGDARYMRRIVPPEGTFIIEDFLGTGGIGNEGLTQTANSGTFTMNVTNATDRDGVVSMRTAASAVAAPTISMGVADIVLGARQRAARYGVRFANLSTGAEEFVARHGFINSTSSAAITNGLWFEYSRAATGDFWVCKSITTAAGNNSTTTAVAVVADTWYDLRIEINTAGTSVTYYIDDVLVATFTDDIPTGTSRPMQVTSQMIKTVGNTERIQYLDYIVYGSGTGADQVAL